MSTSASGNGSEPKVLCAPLELALLKQTLLYMIDNQNELISDGVAFYEFLCSLRRAGDVFFELQVHMAHVAGITPVTLSVLLNTGHVEVHPEANTYEGFRQHVLSGIQSHLVRQASFLDPGNFWSPPSPKSKPFG